MEETVDIVFVVPSYRPIMHEESIGSLILAKIAQISGYNSKIIRYWQVDNKLTDYYDFKNKITAFIKSLSPKIVSFYCRSVEYHVCVDLAQTIKQLSPTSVVIFGGPQAELAAKETLSAFSFVDYICCGEGESSIVPIIKHILDKDLNKNSEPIIPGLVYRNEDNIVCKNPNPKMLPDNYKRGFYYYDLIPHEVFLNSNSLGIDVGRGCPFSCTFCSTKTFWGRKFRLRDIDETLDEIEHVIEHYGINSFSFEHDLFTFRKNRIIEFCAKLKDRKLNIKWDCSTRIDTIDNETIDAMVDCGLYGVYIGIETGSNVLQKTINKNIKIENTIDKVRFLLSKGLDITISFIYGFPQEDYNDLEDTLQLIMKYISLGVRNIQLHKLSFESGTELYARYKDFLISPADFPVAIGLPQLEGLILSHGDIFPNYMDYSSDLRKEMSFLPVFIKMAMVSPRSYDVFLSIMSNHGLKIIDAYRLFFRICGDLIKKLTHAINSKGSDNSPSIYLFLFEVFIKRIIMGAANDVSFAADEKARLLRTLHVEHFRN